MTAWAIDLDDFSNRCCSEPSPLLRAAGRALGRAVPAPPTSPCERPPEPITPPPPTTTPAESDGMFKHYSRQVGTKGPKRLTERDVSFFFTPFLYIDFDNGRE